MYHAENIYYTLVSEIDQSELTTHVVNRTPFLLVLSSPKNRHEPKQTVARNQRLPYALTYPRDGGSKVKFELLDSEGAGLIGFCVETLAVNANEPQLFQSDGLPADGVVEVVIKFAGQNKVIEVSMIRQSQIGLKESEKPTVVEFGVGLSRLGLSVIRMKQDETREELLNLTLTEGAASFSVTGNSQITFAGTFEDLQVDNNSSEKTACPVLLRRVAARAAKKAIQWSFSFDNPRLSSHKFFRWVAFECSSFEVFIEEEYLEKLRRYFAKLHKLISNKLIQSSEDYVLLKYYADLNRAVEGFNINARLWELAEIDNTNDFVYIQLLGLPKTRFVLTYLEDPSTTLDKDLELFSLLGVAVGGFEGASLDIDGRSDTYGTLTQRHLPNQGGSLPAHRHALQERSDQGGLLDPRLAEHSRQPFADRPQLLGRHQQPHRQRGQRRAGDCWGRRPDCQKHHRRVDAGDRRVFGGVNSATGSLAGVFSLMTADKEFIKERGMRKRKKAKNMLEGFGQGAVSLFTGVTDGVIGVVSQPVKGAMEDGVGGLFKGIAKGLTGLVTKPVSGVLDTISKAAEVSAAHAGHPQYHKRRRPRALRARAPSPRVLWPALGHPRLLGR